MSKLLDYLAAAVIAIGVIAIIAISIVAACSSVGQNPFNSTKDRITITVIDSIDTKHDSVFLISNHKLAVKDLDKTLATLEERSKNLDELIERRDKIDFQNSYFLKLIGALGAIILSVVGFFGYKSIHEIREASIRSAQDIATKVASEGAKRIVKQETAKSLDGIMASNRKAYEKHINRLEKRVKKIEDDLSNIEVSEEMLEDDEFSEETRSSSAEDIPDDHSNTTDYSIGPNSEDSSIFG